MKPGAAGVAAIVLVFVLMVIAKQLGWLDVLYNLM